MTEQTVDFPTLGFLISDWIEAHCIVPDGFHLGEPFTLTDEQLWFEVNHYRVKPTASFGQLATAFQFRRSQLVRPQKWGKGPLIAAQCCAEGVGPVVFAGWAEGGEEYRCAEHGCPCGFVYEYDPGEPMGRPWATPLIQITATSEDNTDNIYIPLRRMIDQGPLSEVIPKTGEQFIRLPNDGRIDVVTSNARSRLGNPVTTAFQDETGLWTPETGMVKVAETQRRGLAGMGGRAVETTNCWDPAEGSVAQRTAETTVEDVYRDHNPPPPHLSYRNKQERHRIHRHVYSGSWWVDLDGIEAEANELLEVDPAQAERFFGNRVVAGSDAWLDPTEWDACSAPQEVKPGEFITLGFDGSLSDDHTALVGCRVSDGHLFLLGHWDPADFPGSQIDQEAVDAKVDEVFRTYSVARFYCDPPWWQDYVDRWHRDFGDAVKEWWTNRDRAMSAALERLSTAVRSGTVTHDGDETLARHIKNARRKVRRGCVLISKERDRSPRKIDCAVTAALAYEARADAIAAGQSRKPRRDQAVFV